jgi:hypothetical protein
MILPRRCGTDGNLRRGAGRRNSRARSFVKTPNAVLVCGSGGYLCVHGVRGRADPAAASVAAASPAAAAPASASRAAGPAAAGSAAAGSPATGSIATGSGRAASASCGPRLGAGRTAGASTGAFASRTDAASAERGDGADAASHRQPRPRAGGAARRR